MNQSTKTEKKKKKSSKTNLHYFIKNVILGIQHLNQHFNNDNNFFFLCLKITTTCINQLKGDQSSNLYNDTKKINLTSLILLVIMTKSN